MKLVYQHENQAVIYSIKNTLELNDISCFLKNEFSTSVGGYPGISNTCLELWIADDNSFEKASAIVANETTSSANDTPWQCTACQEENDGSFEVCWNCQSEPAS